MHWQALHRINRARFSTLDFLAMSRCRATQCSRLARARSTAGVLALTCCFVAIPACFSSKCRAFAPVTGCCHVRSACLCRSWTAPLRAASWYKPGSSSKRQIACKVPASLTFDVLLDACNSVSLCSAAAGCTPRITKLGVSLLNSRVSGSAVLRNSASQSDVQADAVRALLRTCCRSRAGHACPVY